VVVLGGVLQVTPIPSTWALLAGGEMGRGTGQRGIQAARRAGARVGAGSATGERGLAENSRAHGWAITDRRPSRQSPWRCDFQVDGGVARPYSSCRRDPQTKRPIL